MSNGLIPPASVIASWPAPNYVDPVRRGPGLLVVNVVFSSLAFILTILRVYTRSFITSTIGLDDVLAVLALSFAIAMCVATSIAAARFGWDRHQWDVPYEWMPALLKYRMIFEMTFCISSVLTKISLLWFCRRLLGSSAKSHLRYLNWSLIAAMVLLLILGILFIFITLLNCIPLKASFDLLPNYPYHCINGNSVIMGASVLNVVTDFMTTIVPMPLIWKLQLPRRQRLAVIGIFGLGITVTIASSIRTYYAWMNSFGSYDSTWWGWATGLSASVEINMGLICASAPALRPLIKAVWPRLLGNSGHGDGYSHQRFDAPKPWLRSSRLDNPHVRMGSNESRTKEVGILSKRHSANETGIVRTVELETYYENRKGVIYGRPVTAHSAISRPLMEARNAYGRRGAVERPADIYFMDRRRDSFPKPSDLKGLYSDDEAPFALERMV